jgi:hypothetical protein
MLLDGTVRMIWGQRVKLACTRLRYELEIVMEINTEGLAQFLINHEALKVIPLEHDAWLAKRSMLPEWETALPIEDPLLSRPYHALLATEGFLSPLTEDIGGERMFRGMGQCAFTLRRSTLRYRGIGPLVPLHI